MEEEEQEEEEEIKSEEIEAKNEVEINKQASSSFSEEGLK